MSKEVAEFRKTLQLFAWRMKLVLLYFDSVFFTCDVSCASCVLSIIALEYASFIRQLKKYAINYGLLQLLNFCGQKR